MRFSAGNITVPLPLTFITVNAQQVAKNIQVNWSTTNELNTGSFDVERSADGVSFRTVGSVAAIDQPGTQQYHFTDNSPVAGTAYYRIKSTDKDGTVQHSQIVMVRTSDDRPFSCYPNPVSSTLVVNHPTAGETARLEIIAADGRIVKTVLLQKGANSTVLNTQPLLSGSYFLRFINGDMIAAINFIKK
jgi:hypothetical protein